MDVKERRKKVEELLRKNLGIYDIAKLLGYATRVIERDVIWIEEHGKSREPDISLSVENEIMLGRKKEEKTSEVKVKRSKQIAKRREEVARLYNEGKTAKEIAEELGITISTVRSDIKLLLKQHIIEKREFERKNGTPKSRKEEKAGNEGKEQTVKQRREQVLTLYASGKGKTKEEKSVRTKSEQRYYNNILKVIKMCLQSRDFKGAVDNIKMLKNEVKLSEEEKDKLDELLTAIVFRLNSHKVAEEDEQDR